MRSPSSHGSSDQDFVDFLESELEQADENHYDHDHEAATASNTMRLEIEQRVDTGGDRQLLCELEYSSKRQKRDPSESKACPPHPGSLYGICIRCGHNIETEDTSNVALRYIHPGLQLAQDEAKRMREQGQRQNLDRRKLPLVLDLDHTLLNSTTFKEVSASQEVGLQEMLASEQSSNSQMLHRLPALSMWTKLRPFVRDFLAAAHKFTEMHIYTHGDQEYAAAMAKLLDPEQKYFQGRIVSQADSTRKHVKNLDVTLGSAESVVIMDDTEGVWPDHRDNLILVERYIFFPGDARRFFRDHSLFESGNDEVASSGQLNTSLQVLQALHQRLFSEGKAADLDVRHELRLLEAEILRGVYICFTQVIPLTDRDKTVEPTSHPCWRLAEKLGAACSLVFNSSITHVVAGGAHTEKVAQARKKGIPVVSVDWLYAAAFLWKRMDENDFPVTSETTAPKVDESQDVRAALEAAGGGRGADSLKI